MKYSINKSMCVLTVILLLAVSGCGYTTRSLLPTSFKSIYIANFKNNIKITAEQNELRMYRGYRPGMEVDITKAVIDRFLTDGNLKVSTENNCDLILKSELMDFRREGVRYDANENVEEYRIKLIVDLELKNAGTGSVLWSEKSFTGETTYRTGGTLAKTEESGVRDAISDLARRIVERTVEAW